MMDNFKYHLIIFFLKCFACFPLWMLYGLSDLMSVVLRRVVRYRLNVVRSNLAHAFPDKSPKELAQIEKAFYRHMCDCIVETVKLLHISEKEIRRRVVVRNPEVVRKLAEENFPVILYLGHYGNWEWVQAISMHVDKPEVMGAIYQPVQDKVMDRVMLRIRSRFKTLCIPSLKAYRKLLDLRRQRKTFMIGFIADQRPISRVLPHWTDFFNRRAAYTTGAETIGERIGAKYVYVDVERIKRGYYALTFKQIEPTSKESDEFPYTLRFLEMLEETIRRDPPYWLWSHNRWKHKEQRIIN